jgi:hypothetical protein
MDTWIIVFLLFLPVLLVGVHKHLNKVITKDHDDESSGDNKEDRYWMF